MSEQYPGRTVEDPYRWLEGLSPENEWVEQQDRRARRWLSRLPARTEVRDLLQEFQSMPRLQLLDQYGDQVYFFHDRGASNQVDLYRAPARVFHTWSCPGAARCDRLPPDAEPVLLAGDREEGSRLRAVSISPDGNAVAWAEQSGDRLQWSWKPAGGAGRSSRPIIAEAAADLLWRADGRGWYVIRSGKDGDWLELRSRHGAGPDPRVVCPLRAGLTIERLHRIDERDRQVLLQVDSGDSRQVLVCDVRTDTLRVLYERIPESLHYLGTDDGRHYFLFAGDAWRGEIVAVMVSEGGQVRQETVVSAMEGHRLVGAELVPSAEMPGFWLHYRVAGRSELGFHSGAPDATAELIRSDRIPDVMRIEVMRHLPDTGDLYLGLSGPAVSPRVLRVPGRHGEVETVWSSSAPSETGPLGVRRYDVDTGAGSLVPVYVAGRGSVLDGDDPAPLVLEAHGGFDVPVDLRYSPSRAAWMALGGLYAVAGVRGGGDYGLDWYLAGRGSGKMDSIRDLEVVAARLIDDRLTDGDRLALAGNSQGASLAAAAAARGRQPVRALLVSAGVMDLLRYPLHGAGSRWVDEYGDPGRRSDLETLLSWSPYHQVLEGVHDDHPLTLVMTRGSDPVVPALHSYKYLAVLQRAGVPALLRVEQGATHAETDTIPVLRQRYTDLWSFLLAVLRP